MWNANEARGKADQVKGRIEQTIGALTEDQALVEKGNAEEIAGKVETAIGRVAKNAIEGVAHIGHARKRSKH